ncbi:energy-coupling factor ABC transporter ATP-binding protein [Photobacterium sp. OFAV2-7]|uniref:energy-coupling factor ABC transporter ATP-binding protein n=1 Tax=Photobacterium sp. OFAV2-7 TaxID=2917748 RepID=UPI001EF622A2|nr:ABC transporter ATP-binding protein [Photobacterium sp. OFAV2-7]MCG7587193.1 energy-coupling factor ABC transporter ATP-binding protein [Photobacterium sp. OFAV2-7]
MTLIELNNVVYKRPNGTYCADRLNFRLDVSQKVSITGSNGSGKSTLLQLILGLLQPTEGEIKLFGQVCSKEADFAAVRTRLGLVFQDPDDQLFCPTVLEDVCFGPINQGPSQLEAEKLSLQTLRRLGIEHLANEVSYRLSGGQKRLAALATVLVMKPDVLLLDEPTNGLDDKNYQLLIDVINSLSMPLVLISHDEQLRDALTNIEYRLENGKLTLVPSSADELMAQDEPESAS